MIQGESGLSHTGFSLHLLMLWFPIVWSAWSLWCYCMGWLGVKNKTTYLLTPHCVITLVLPYWLTGCKKTQVTYSPLRDFFPTPHCVTFFPHPGSWRGLSGLRAGQPSVGGQHEAGAAAGGRWRWPGSVHHLCAHGRHGPQTFWVRLELFNSATKALTPRLGGAGTVYLCS